MRTRTVNRVGPGAAGSRRVHAGGSRARATTTAVGVLSIAAVLGVGVVASSALPANTVFVNEGFSGATSGSDFVLPTPVTASFGAVNGACLTAGSSTTQTPIPGCALSPADASGSGTLRFNSDHDTLGAVASTKSFPITQGLDAVFNTYQYHPGTNAADGIGFYLAATDPTNPTVPSTTGFPGGGLGYAPLRPSPGPFTGLPYGYLGIGFDSFGNYRTSVLDGTGCPSNTYAATGNTVTVRGPGNQLAGYCPLSSVTASSGSLRANTSVRSAAQVPVEILINPGSSVSTSVFNPAITVPANSYEVVFTPVGGAQQTLVGALPTIPSGMYPASWIDPSGRPYKLTYGWLGASGTYFDTHEVDSFQSQSLNGAVPVLSATNSAASTLASGASSTVSITPTVTIAGGDEAQPVTVTTTFPTGLTPTAPSSSPWVCTVSGQVSTCTYTPSSAVTAGTALPTLSLPFTSSGPAVLRTVTYQTSSNDATAVTGSIDVQLTAPTAAVTTAALAATGGSDLGALALLGMLGAILLGVGITARTVSTARKHSA